MFEAVMAFCVMVETQVCRAQLLPGYEAATQADCVTALEARPSNHPARCVPVGQALEVVEIAPGVFVHEGQIGEPDQINRGDVSNLGFVIGRDAVAVIDAGSARWMGEALWRAIRARTDLPVSHIVLTHMHPDHVLGAAPLAEAGAQVVGHANLPRALADRQANYLESLERLIGLPDFLGTAPAPVNVTLSDTLDIDLGGRVLRLQAWPNAHTGTDITVLDGATQTLFAGDLVFHRHLPALDGKLIGWRAVLKTLEETPIKRLVPGHGDAVLDWPAGAADVTRYLGVLEADTRAAIERGDRLGEAVEIIAASEAEAWELFEEFNPRNATVAFTELEWE